MLYRCWVKQTELTCLVQKSKLTCIYPIYLFSPRRDKRSNNNPGSFWLDVHLWSLSTTYYWLLLMMWAELVCISMVYNFSHAPLLCSIPFLCVSNDVPEPWNPKWFKATTQKRDKKLFGRYGLTQRALKIERFAMVDWAQPVQDAVHHKANGDKSTPELRCSHL